MELALIGAVALATAVVTLVSGFGLGTVLMPVFALFFPLPLAISAAAIVHFASNLFKLGLMARGADWRVVARYSLGQSHFEVTFVKLVVGVLILGFGALELSRRFELVSFPPRWLPCSSMPRVSRCTAWT